MIPDASVLQRDSAGIQVVTVSTPVSSFGEIGRTDDQPSLQLGSIGSQGRDLFGSVVDVRQGVDGSIFVLDRQAGEVRVFDAKGTFSYSLGRSGEGPGEFGRAQGIIDVVADDVTVWDSRLRRATEFRGGGEAGEVVSTTRLDAFRGRGAVYRDPAGSFIAAVPWSAEAIVTTGGVVFRRDSVALVRYDPEGRGLDTIAVRAGREILEEVESLGGGAFRTRRAVAPVAHEFAFTTYSGGIVGGANDSFELSWWDQEGTLSRISRFPSLDRPLTAVDIQALKDEIVAESDGSPDVARAVDARFSAHPLPELRPAFEKVLPGPHGVWVREHRLWEGDRPRWWLIDPDEGVPVGYALFPSELTVHEIGPDYVLGVHVDELGVSYVRRYGLHVEPL